MWGEEEGIRNLRARRYRAVVVVEHFGRSHFVRLLAGKS